MVKERSKQHRLGFMLKLLLKEHSLSMRKLSEAIGMDTATISRIINGKQNANVEHLQKFSNYFNVPMKQLLEAAGIEMEGGEKHSDMYASMEIIKETLEYSNLFDQQSMIPRIEQELEIYRSYALTEEGQQIVYEKFQLKTQNIDGMGPFIEHLRQMYARFTTENVSEDERAILGSVLLYFIMSTDIIPDYVFPIGYLDDAIAIKLGLNQLAQIEEELEKEGWR